MKRRLARNGPVWRSSAAATLALVAMAFEAPAIADAAQAFSPPLSSLLLSRTLTRTLPDGKTITTRRSYEVRFQRDGDGYRVDGNLVDVTVDVPPSLRALADLERQRPDNGLFPIRLDADGRIIGGGNQTASPVVARAAQVAAEQIGGSGLTALDMLQAQAFVARLRSGSAHSKWPDDVFRPFVGKRSETRTVPLPGGEEGQVVIEIEGRRGGSAGQVGSVHRVVTTDLGGDRRVTRELWELVRHSGEASR